MSKGRILIVEDDLDGADILDAYLNREGFQTRQAADGHQALELYRRWRPDLVLLDVMLPGLSGNEVLAAIRQHASTAVIMVTAVADQPRLINSLLYGADDYVVKPYHPGEVVARVHAVLRRMLRPLSGAAQQAVLRHGALTLDPDAALATVDKDGHPQALTLTRTELNLLALMMAAPTRMFSRAELLAHSQPESDAMERVVDAHLHNLRRKLEQAGIREVVVTVRGLGYRFRNPS
ncbi:response regulator transcription factor [Herbaspirillum seropedicae]|uniref:response regulator transcription factor n=1 Tax=Herbaspirillum seropedicae TaxID=964 RepID=UPI003D9540ED